MGGITVGWSLYTKNGKPKYCYNFFGLQQTYVEGANPLAPGQHQLRMEFADDGGGIAKGGKVSLFVDGNKTGEGRIEQTEPFAFGEETCDVGHEGGSPVTTDYSQNGGTAFFREGELGGVRRWHRGRQQQSPHHVRGTPSGGDGEAVVIA